MGNQKKKTLDPSTLHHDLNLYSNISSNFREWTTSSNPKWNLVNRARPNFKPAERPTEISGLVCLVNESGTRDKKRSQKITGLFLLRHVILDQYFLIIIWSCMFIMYMFIIVNTSMFSVLPQSYARLSYTNSMLLNSRGLRNNLAKIVISKVTL